jgi:hypothetical protein
MSTVGHLQPSSSNKQMSGTPLKAKIISSKECEQSVGL